MIEAGRVPTPTLSVVVTVVDGGAALQRCLAALTAQDAALPLDVIVPWDDSVPEVAGLAPQYRAVRFLPLGRLATQHPIASEAGRHECFDRRRAAGLAAATGDLVAIVEDRGIPAPDWARAFARLHAALPYEVIGGAVDLGRPGTAARAVYLCDFGRYAPPFTAGPRDYVTDVNVCYKRGALERTRVLWAERYHETTVHWALRRGGATLWLSPEPVVRQERDGLTVGGLLRERRAWGRLFAYTRSRESPAAVRLVRAALAPVLPLVMGWRIVRREAVRGRLTATLPTLPLLLCLLAAWAAGEAEGYLSGRP